LCGRPWSGHRMQQHTCWYCAIEEGILVVHYVRFIFASGHRAAGAYASAHAASCSPVSSKGARPKLVDDPACARVVRVKFLYQLMLQALRWAAAARLAQGCDPACARASAEGEEAAAQLEVRVCDGLRAGRVSGRRGRGRGGWGALGRLCHHLGRCAAGRSRHRCVLQLRL